MPVTMLRRDEIWGVRMQRASVDRNRDRERTRPLPLVHTCPDLRTGRIVENRYGPAIVPGGPRPRPTAHQAPRPRSTGTLAAHQGSGVGTTHALRDAANDHGSAERMSQARSSAHASLTPWSPVSHVREATAPAVAPLPLLRW